MKSKSIGLLLILLIISSCISEKNVGSPLNTTFYNDGSTVSVNERIAGSFKTNTNAAEITNLISTMPTFGLKNVDAELGKLKKHIENYLYAVEAFNKNGRKRNLQYIEATYKNLQTFRKKLSPENDDVLNQYLVKIKRNITVLESEAAQNLY